MGLFWGTSVEDKDDELTDERQIVAHHEAGHMIACNRHNIPYTDVTVSVSRTYWTGQLRSSGHIHLPENAFYIYDRPILAVVALSGIAAEAMYYMEILGWRKSKAWQEAEDYASIDSSNADACVGKRGMREAERAAYGLISSQWGSVLRLAKQL